DRAWVDVAGGGDAALAAVPHVVEQERLAAGEYVEAVLRERVEHGFRVRPIAGGILHAGDAGRIFLQQALDQVQGDGDLGNGRDVVQVELQPLVADALDHLGEVAVEAFVGDAL